MATLALFELDHTLLDGDGDDLWCRFLLRHGLVGADMPLVEWDLWEYRFLAKEIRHRLPAAARTLVASHRAAGHTLVLTTASNSVIA